MNKQERIEEVRKQLRNVSDEIDRIVLDGGRVTLKDPLSRKMYALRKRLARLSK